MEPALVLTASCRGRPAAPSADGRVLVVEHEAPVLVEAWPQPAAWDPDGVRLLRDGDVVGGSAQTDRMRWMLLGDERFGRFQAVVPVEGRFVTSPVLVVSRPESAPPSTEPTATGDDPALTAPPLTEPAPLPAPAAVGPAAVPIVVLPPDPVPQVRAPRPIHPPPAAADPAAAVPQPGAPSAMPGTPPADPTPAAPSMRAQADSTAAPDTTDPGPRLPSHARPQDLAEFETPLNEYDGRFTVVVAVLFVALSTAVVGLIITRLLGEAAWYLAAGGQGPDPVIDGSSAERIGMGSATILIALGAVLVLAGGALAAMEVRGRQRREPRPHLVARGTARSLGIVPRILDHLARVPATIAVLTTGGVILALGFIAQVHWAAQI